MVPDLTQAADSMNKRRALVVKFAEVSDQKKTPGLFHSMQNEDQRLGSMDLH